MTKTLEPPKVGGMTDIAGIDMASLNNGFAVEALNNDISTFQDVISVFVKVCRYDAGKAKTYAQKIDREGRAVCFWADKAECEKVIMAFKGILVECRLLDN